MERNGQKTHDYGAGTFRFVLGRSHSGVFGHVELLLERTPAPSQVSVRWRVETNNHADDAREQVEQAAARYMRGYVAWQPDHGFLVTITDVTSDRERRNDYERATAVALRVALEEMGLPVPQIFGP